MNEFLERYETPLAILAVIVVLVFGIPAVIGAGFLEHWLLRWIGCNEYVANALIAAECFVLLAIFLSSIT